MPPPVPFDRFGYHRGRWGEAAGTPRIPRGRVMVNSPPPESLTATQDQSVRTIRRQVALLRPFAAAPCP